jgi:hypothetical protein
LPKRFVNIASSTRGLTFAVDVDGYVWMKEDTWKRLPAFPKDVDGHIPLAVQVITRTSEKFHITDMLALTDDGKIFLYRTGINDSHCWEPIGLP